MKVATFTGILTAVGDVSVPVTGAIARDPGSAEPALFLRTLGNSGYASIANVIERDSWSWIGIFSDRVIRMDFTRSGGVSFRITDLDTGADADVRTTAEQNRWLAGILDGTAA